MSKTIAMIPVRLGSKRVKNKNLRLIDGKPLICYVLETAVKSDIFDEIYINSESDIFEPIAKKYGVEI
jgi:CMP-N-acetylneuraminic acid synthetase